jgi:pSer/pThr/pTyr-binding forkhead associated (FHA) protein
MPGKVTLSVVAGEPLGQEYAFTGRTLCALGRANDCHVHIPNDWLHVNVSRHHCLLDINPPQVLVRDLGSRNGTFVNGELIGQRRNGQFPESPSLSEFLDHPLYDGDELRVGDMVFLVTVTESSGDRSDRDLSNSQVLAG